MKQIVLSLIVGIGLGLGFGYKIYKPKTRIETYQPEIRQADKSLILERKPGFEISKPIIPPGSELTRQAEIIVKPKDCPEIRVNLALVRLPDSSFRVIANSPDGTIIGGVDVPISTQDPGVDPKWAVGGIYKPNGYGLFIERTLGALVIGIDLTRNKEILDRYTMDYALRLGVRF